MDKVLDMLGLLLSNGLTKRDLVKEKQESASDGFVEGEPSDEDYYVFECTVCGNTVDAERDKMNANLTCSRCGSPMKLKTVRSFKSD